MVGSARTTRAREQRSEGGEAQATDGRFGDGSRPLRGRAHRPPREPHSADQTTKECLAKACLGEELELGLEEFGGLPLG